MVLVIALVVAGWILLSLPLAIAIGRAFDAGNHEPAEPPSPADAPSPSDSPSGSPSGPVSGDLAA